MANPNDPTRERETDNPKPGTQKPATGKPGTEQNPNTGTEQNPNQEQPQEHDPNTDPNRKRK